MNKEEWLYKKKKKTRKCRDENDLSDIFQITVVINYVYGRNCISLLGNIDIIAEKQSTCSEFSEMTQEMCIHLKKFPAYDKTTITWNTRAVGVAMIQAHCSHSFFLLLLKNTVLLLLKNTVLRRFSVGKSDLGRRLECQHRCCVQPLLTKFSKYSNSVATSM